MSAVDTIEFTFDYPFGVAPDFPLPIVLLGVTYATDGSSGTIQVQVNGPAIEVNLFYNGSEYDKVFLVR